MHSQREIFKVVEEMPRFYSATCEAKKEQARKSCAEDALNAAIPHHHYLYYNEAFHSIFRSDGRVL